MSRKNNSDSKNSEVPAGSFEQVFEMSPVLPGRSAGFVVVQHVLCCTMQGVFLTTA